MSSIRLFTGLSLPPDLLHKFGVLLSDLIPLASIKWSPVVNLHITIKFIGNWPASRVPELVDVLNKLPREGNVAVHLSGFDFFPRALVAKVDLSPALQNLAARTELALGHLGIAPERREYRPHLTLARLASRTGIEALRTKI